MKGHIGKFVQPSGDASDCPKPTTRSETRTRSRAIGCVSAPSDASECGRHEGLLGKASHAEKGTKPAGKGARVWARGAGVCHRSFPRVAPARAGDTASPRTPASAGTPSVGTRHQSPSTEVICLVLDKSAQPGSPPAAGLEALGRHPD